MCCKNSLAIFHQVFTSLTINLTKALYKQLPENTVGEKILKQRLTRNIERKDFCKIINAEKKTVELWELHGLVPTAKSIKKICDLFELPLEYFCEYYAMYFNTPEKFFCNAIRITTVVLITLKYLKLQNLQL